MQKICANWHGKQDFHSWRQSLFLLTARFPNPEAFIAGEIEVDTAAIPSMQHLDSQAREGIIRAITKDMQSP